MEITLAQYEQIERYLDGRMSAEEIDQFEGTLKTNTALREFLAFEQRVFEELQLMQLDDDFSSIGLTAADLNRVPENASQLREALAAAAHDWQSAKRAQNPLQATVKNAAPKPPPVIPLNGTGTGRWYWVAAAILLLLAIGAVWLLFLKPLNQKDEYVKDPKDSVKTVQPEIVEKKPAGEKERPVVPPPKTIDYAALSVKYYVRDTVPKEKNQLLEAALDDFDASDYSTILALDLSRLPPPRAGDDNQQSVIEWGHYYKGLAFWETRQIPKAIKELDWTSKQARKPFLRIKASWYLGLCFLQSGEPAKAIALFTEIKEQEQLPTYAQQANKLLAEINHAKTATP